MKKTLIVYGHPRPEASNANKRILEEVKQARPDVEIVTLAELYPDGNIDVPTEQARLLQADVIVFQYPIWWYSAPSLMHRYLEEVFSAGFAFGGATLLEGKTLIASFTCGAPEKNYLPGASGENVDNMALPIKATCWLCKIGFAGAVGTYGAMYYGLTSQEQIDAVNARISDHARRLLGILPQ